MPVDKAWEEYRESDDWVRDDDEKPYREGYFEGQKSLSPEVREVLKELIGSCEQLTKDKRGIFVKCIICKKTNNYDSWKVFHNQSCAAYKAEKLLAK